MKTSKPVTFTSREQLRAWLERHHGTATELIVRTFKLHARHRGVTYPEVLDEALCFGWIDGVRRSLDEDSFTTRLSPRRPKSNWSAVNVRRATQLEAEGRMHPAGLQAFHARTGTAPAPYSPERPPAFDAAALRTFRTNRKAWACFQDFPAWYRRAATFWVTSAKRPETRERRLAILIDRCAKREPIPPLSSAKPVASASNHRGKGASPSRRQGTTSPKRARSGSTTSAAPGTRSRRSSRSPIPSPHRTAPGTHDPGRAGRRT